MRLYYAQNREDLLIKSFFPDVDEGFYIDVGANDPLIDSVTKLFYDAGWRGINIEPIQKHFDGLMKSRPHDINLQIGLSSKPGTLDFIEYPEGDGLSTFDTSMQKYYAQGDHPFPTSKAKKYKVPVKTLSEVLEEQKVQHVHFIKIDVEGYEYEVIKSYSWQGVRPELICIEANHIHHDWRPMLIKNKYHEVFFDGINNYYLAEESLKRKEYFNYPDAVFAGNPVYYQAFMEVKAEANKKATELQKVLTEKEQDIALLHRQQRDVRFLAKRLAVETQARLNKRAKGLTLSEHLRYQASPEIEAELHNDRLNQPEALAKIHRLDAKNIHPQRVTLKDKLQPLSWKVAATTFNASVRTAKKVRRG